MKLLAIILMSTSSLVFADYIFIDCGNKAGQGYLKAEVNYSAETLTPEDRNDWRLHLKGKVHKKAETVVVIRKEGQLSGYVVTEKKPANGHAYKQFHFTHVDNCFEGGPAWLKVYRVGTGEGKQQLGSTKKCVCGID